MKRAGNGDRIKVHYTGTLDDGTVFDSSRERNEPLEFEIGSGQLIRDFEEAIIGMAVGESKVVRIPAERAYGPYMEDCLIEVPMERFPADIVPCVGLALCLQRNDGSSLNVVVTAVAGDSVTLDANHPMAGKDLTFDIELVSIDRT